MKTTLAPGLPTALLLRWSVSIHDAVGEPFLSSWKAYIASLLAKRTTAPLAALDPACQSPRRKRQKRSAEPHPRGVKRPRASSAASRPPVLTTAERVKRLKAAHASAAAAAASGSVTTSSSSAPPPRPSTPGGLPPPCARTSCGRAAQGPPT